MLVSIEKLWDKILGTSRQRNFRVSSYVVHWYGWGGAGGGDFQGDSQKEVDFLMKVARKGCRDSPKEGDSEKEGDSL